MNEQFTSDGIPVARPQAPSQMPEVTSPQPVALEDDPLPEEVQTQLNKFEGVALEEYDLSGCSVKMRDGSTSNPFDGCSVWLMPYNSVALANSLAAYSGATTDEDGAGMGLAFDDMREGLSEVTAAWDVRDAFGDLLPQPYGNSDVFRTPPAELVYGLAVLAVGGETPWEKEDGSSGSGGGHASTRSTKGPIRKTDRRHRRRRR